MRRALPAISAVLLAASVVTGCAAQPAPTVDETEPAAPEVEIIPFERVDVDLSMFAGAGAAPAVARTVDLTDDYGYTFTVGFVPGGTSATSDITDSRPGFAELTVSAGGSIVITNTTPNRNAPGPVISAVPLWTSDSPVCSLWMSSTSNDVPGYCTYRALVDQQRELAIGARVETRPTFTVNETVSETAAAALVDAFAKPAGWVLGSNDSASKECGVPGTTGLTQWLLWSSIELGCGVPVFDPLSSGDAADSQVSVGAIAQAAANLAAGINAYSQLKAAEVPDSVRELCPFGDASFGADLPLGDEYAPEVSTFYYTRHMACAWPAWRLTAIPGSSSAKSYIQANKPEASKLSESFEWASGAAIAYCYPESDSDELLGCGVTWTSSGELVIDITTALDESTTLDEGFAVILSWFHEHANEMIQHAASTKVA